MEDHLPRSICYVEGNFSAVMLRITRRSIVEGFPKTTRRRWNTMRERNVGMVACYGTEQTWDQPGGSIKAFDRSTKLSQHKNHAADQLDL